MIIIADSGSSKIDWVSFQLLAPSHRRRDQAQSYYNLLKIWKGYQRNLLSLATEKVKRIYFYVPASRQKESGHNDPGILKFFPEAMVDLTWDLLAPSRALCGTEPGNACILGTGSNSVSMIGEKITYHGGQSGLILADEGSGTSLGKKLFFDY